jgi:hypothetical protein
VAAVAGGRTRGGSAAGASSGTPTQVRPLLADHAAAPVRVLTCDGRPRLVVLDVRDGDHHVCAAGGRAVQPVSD